MPIKKYKYKKSTQRFHFWDESNRLCSTVVDGGKLIHNIYDASGERTLKAHSEYQGVFENGTPTDGGATLESYTTYPSAYMTIARNAVYTKHYFAGTQRVASKPAGSATRFNVFTLQEYEELKLKQLGDAQAVADSVDLGELVLKDTDPGTLLPAVYFFHPDHLGSSTMITDGAGYAYQMFLNLPFGETMAEQRRSGSLNNLYKFNGKELDGETGLYYYGARYYDPRLSIFISVDPLAEQTMTPYQYTYQNPINLIDPTGMSGEDWIRGMKNGQQDVRWFNTMDEASRYYDKGSKLENLGDNFMKTPENLTSNEGVSVGLQQISYLSNLANLINDSFLGDLNPLEINAGPYQKSDTSIGSYLELLTISSLYSINNNAGRGFAFGPYAKENNWGEFLDFIKEQGINQGKSLAFSKFFGKKNGGVLNWFLKGPDIYNGENSLNVIFEKTKESLFKNYNNNVKSYMNRNSKILYNNMINRKYPSFMKVKINN